jgi:hypothetical protein
VLPTEAALNQDLKVKMKKATEDMQAALDKVAANEEKARNNCKYIILLQNTYSHNAAGVKWYYFIAWPITLGTALHHNSERKDAEQAMKDADKSYKDVLSEAGSKLASVMRMRCNAITVFALFLTNHSQQAQKILLK